jgi:riboflavin transporter FmnP
MEDILENSRRSKQKLISEKRLIFRKIRPRYKKALIPALIICFIIAVILLLILNKYLFKPIFEKKGSVPSKHSIGVICLMEEKIFGDLCFKD